MRERLSNLVLLLRCAALFLLRGSARRATPVPKSVAVVQFGKLGDMVCTTPMFRGIKAHAPVARVIVVGDKIGELLLAGNTDIDRYIVCGRDITAALAALKEEHVDAAVTVGPSLRAVALLYLAGIPTIVAPRVEGGPSSESRTYRLVRRLCLLVPHRIGQYAPREYLNLLEPLGIRSEDTTKRLRYTDEAARAAGSILRQAGMEGTLLVGIAVSAGNKVKNWLPERFAAVADHLAAARGARVVLMGGPGDKAESDAVKALLSPSTPCLDTTGALSIEELKALISRLSLFVSVDTGPIYIAEAFGVPTVDIVGPMDEREQPPRGPRHIAVVPPFKRSPQLYIMSRGAYDYAEARRQAEGITADQVINAAEALLLDKTA